MKATLRFDMDEPSDRNDFHRATRAAKYLMALSDFEEYLRGKTKYGAGEGEDDKTFEIVQAKFNEILSDETIENLHDEWENG